MGRSGAGGVESSVATLQSGNRRRLEIERWDLLGAVVASLVSDGLYSRFEQFLRLD